MDSLDADDQAHTRHYPLDLPSLPFDRYEHRHITARDVLVHRIMAAIMSPPNTALASALRDHRTPGPRLRPESGWGNDKMPKHHNFPPLRQYDRELARDVELLRKMLTTRGAHEYVPEAAIRPLRGTIGGHGGIACRESYRTTYLWNHAGSGLIKSPTGGLSVEDEILDLVQRHYLEMDDPATRLWLQTIMKPTQRSADDTVSKDSGKKGTRRLAVQERKQRDAQNAEYDHKKWYDEDVEHLKSLQRHSRFAGETRLYEGGAALASLRQPLQRSREKRSKFLSDTMRLKDVKSFFSEDQWGQEAIVELFPWPEGVDVPRRVLHMPSFWSWRQRHDFIFLRQPPLDFASGRTGRGLDRDGIWSTARWEGDALPRGRRVQKGRRRAASEPPPGLFTCARLPVDFNINRELLIFPKMKLSTMDRRSRRRSLSRTRIADMFHWETILERPPRQRHVFPPDRWQEERSRQNKVLYRELVRAYAVFRISLNVVNAAAWDRAPEWESRRLHRWPRWWRAIDGESGVSFACSLPADYHPSHRAAWRAWVCSCSRGMHLDDRAWFIYQTPLPTKPAPPTPSQITCENCGSGTHPMCSCEAPCGHCGAPTPITITKHVVNPKPCSGAINITMDNNKDDEDDTAKANQHQNPHFAPTCPVAQHNRCRCGPFPQYHVAAKCPVLCSRDCGNHTHPPGHFRHRNAMGCKSRCCMCGMRGHSGVQCKLRRCRCGGRHLGQDCCFNPECHVVGCDRFLCGVHCQRCGLARSELKEGVGFVQRRCPDCVLASGGVCDEEEEEDVTVASGDEEFHDAVETQPPQPPQQQGPGPSLRTTNGRARRKNKRKQRPDVKPAPPAPPSPKPWYAPLAPRTKPVAGNKSGKDKWGWKADAAPAVRIGGCR